MGPRITLFRASSRLMITVGLIATMGAVLLVIVTHSHLLEPIGEAGWAVFSLGIGYMGQALVRTVTAIAQNPSDRGKLSEEDA